MNCEQHGVLISGFIDGELSAEQKSSLTTHLQTCAICRTELAEIQNIKILASNIKKVTPSPAEWKEFHNNLNKNFPARRFPRKILVKAVSVALVALCSVILFLYYPESKGKNGEFSLEDGQKEMVDLSAWKPREATATPWQVTHNAVQITPAVLPYLLNEKIKGLAKANLSREQMEFLLKHGFVVTEKRFPSFVSLYRQNQNDKIPSYITLDMTISGFSHIFARLRVDMEREVLLSKLIEFTKIIGQELIILHGKVPNSSKQASLRALAFVKVADHLLGSCHISWPEEIETLIADKVEKELKLIYTGRTSHMIAIQKSPIFGTNIDYNLFKIPWNESKDEKLKRYYQTLEWYNRCVFRSSHHSETQSALLMLMAVIKKNGEGMDVWQDMNHQLTMMYGKPDDPHFLDYLKVARDIYGDIINPKILTEKKLLDEFCRKISKVRPPRLRSEVRLHAGLRIFGERSYERDLYLQQLVYPNVGKWKNSEDLRIRPSVIDLAVILGNSKTKKIAQDRYFEFDHYREKVFRFQNTLNKNLRMGNPWRKGGLTAQAWLYEAVMRTEGKKYPIFAQSSAWDARKLTGILCCILNLAEINSKPVFIGKSNAEFQGFVDPYPEFFNRLVTIIKELESRFPALGYPNTQPTAREIVLYRKALQNLVEISQKSLRGESINEQDGKILADFALGWQGDYQETNINEINIIFHRNNYQFDSYFYVGVEPVRELWVACPGENGAFLARGGVYLLYEFPTGRKILPEKWREKQMWKSLKRYRLPWINEYTR